MNEKDKKIKANKNKKITKTVKANNQEKDKKIKATKDKKITKIIKANNQEKDKKIKDNKNKKITKTVKDNNQEKDKKITKIPKNNYKKNRITFIAYFFLLFIIGILGYAYAIFHFVDYTSNIQAITGELYLIYLGGESINMNNILPSDTYDEKSYFEFSVKGKNTSTRDVLYEIILEHGENIDGKIRIDDKFLKFRLVEVIDEEEVEIFNNREYTSIDNTSIHIDGVSKNTNQEMEKTYRLYVWVNGVLIGNTDDCDYTSSEWANIYSNINVLVRSNSNLDLATYTVKFTQPLPDEYQEVEYIEANGTQWINTGINGTNNIYAEIDMEYTATSSGSQVILGRAVTAGNWTGQYGGYYAVGPSYKLSINSNLRKTLKITFNSNGVELQVDEETVSRSGNSSSTNYYLFSASNGASYPSKAKMYNAKLYDENHTLIRNFIPCYRKSDNIIGLYDMINMTFYTTSGTETFSKGADVPNGYHDIVSSQHFVYGIAQNLNANTYTIEGYEFKAWNTKPDGSGLYYLDSENVKNLSSVDEDIINLYPMFEPIKSYAGYYVYDMLKENAVADNQKSKFVTNETGIDFFDVSSKENGYGVYTLSSTINDEYPVYYYRGNVQTNNILFDGFCWKIIRTTDTGGTKLIYNGKPVDGKCDNYGLDTFTSSGVYFATTTSTTVGLASAGYSYTETSKLVTHTKTSANIGKVPGTIFSSDIEYVEITDETTGQTSWKYRLIGEKVTSTGTDAATFNAEREALLKEHHYTCFSATSDVCSTVYFVYMVRDNNNYYASFSNGLFLNDFLNIEFNGNSTNLTKSTVHTNVNNWYINNLLDVNHYIEDTVYCNDRTLYQPWTNTSSVANNEDEKTHFGAKARVAYTGGVTVNCPNVMDSFTVSKDKGNGALENPIGLITLDEVVLAGYAWGKTSTENYLYTGDSNKVWWTMSPGFISATGVYPGVVYSMLDTVGVNYRGTQDSNRIWSGGGVRPVISLKNNIIIGSGYGTKNEPFILQ